MGIITVIIIIGVVGTATVKGGFMLYQMVTNPANWDTPRFGKLNPGSVVDHGSYNLELINKASAPVETPINIHIPSYDAWVKFRSDWVEHYEQHLALLKAAGRGVDVD